MGTILFDTLFLIAAVCIILVFAKRGFIRSVIHFFKTLIAFLAAYFLGSKLAQFLCDTWIGGAVRNFIYDKINAIYQSTTETLNAESVIESMPGFLMTEEMQAKLHAAQGSGEELVNSMTDAISSPIASLFSNILGYVGVFLIALVLLWIVAAIVDKLVEHLALINTANILLGGLLGLIVAFVILSAIASLMRFFLADSAIYTDSVIIKFFGESPILKTLKFLDLGSSWFEKLLG